jgi:outer membrane protein assembly factor BamE (lipoprotein component of BamABCDE complex)
MASVILIAGCGMFSRATTADPSAGGQAAAAAAPAPPSPPRPSLREAGARIADEETLKDLVQGKTTKAEVRERFGVPQAVVFSPGIETFVYHRDRTSGWFTRTTERVEMLTVRFDSQGILKDFEYRFSGK